MSQTAAKPRKSARSARSAPNRFDVAARVLAATLGAYIVCALAGAWLARALHIAPSEAASTGLIASLALFPIVPIWAFAARRIWIVWTTLAAISIALALTLWVLLVLPR